MVALYGETPTAMIKAILSKTGTIETPEMLKSVEIEPDATETLETLLRDFGEHR